MGKAFWPGMKVRHHCPGETGHRRVTRVARVTPLAHVVVLEDGTRLTQAQALRELRFVPLKDHAPSGISYQQMLARLA